jgi:hypothetical protein
MDEQRPLLGGTWSAPSRDQTLEVVSPHDPTSDKGDR